MRATQVHTRIVQHSFALLMQGALLNSYDENGQDLILEVQGLQDVSSELFEREGKIYEHIVGKYIRLQLKFSNVTKLNRADFFTSLENIAQDDPLRTIEDMLSWRQPKASDIFHLIGLRGPIEAEMNFFARKVSY